MAELSSRERMLRALRRQPPDYVPCSFMSFTALRRRFHEDFYELAKAERAMGLDSFLFIPTAGRPQRPDHPELRGLPVRFHPAVETREWREEVPGDYPILHKEYNTPAGKLRASVRLSEDWPHGNHLPFVDDYQVSRALKPLITEAKELEALRYLLRPPQAEDIAQFQREAEKAHAFVKEQGILLAGGWGVGADMANWLCGVQNLIVLAHEQPVFVIELLEMIHVWNKQRMAVVLSAPVDLFIQRAWYEGCDFVRPQFYREVILPRLKSEAALAHEHGARFAYICSSGTAPLLDFYPEAGIDVLIGVDPVQGTHTDMELMKRKIGEKVCLWGGLSGAVTVEMGSEEEVREAVRLALQTLGPTGFILSPVDNLTVDAPRTWRNVEVLLDEWRRRR
jgi:uroporphyrinogen-III decarboxylase